MPRARLGLFAALTTLLALPALLSGGALWFDDVAPYAKGGQVALETAWALVEGDAGAGGAQAAAAGGEEAPAALAPEGVSGVRSVAYSVFTAALLASRGDGLLIALVQAGVIAALLCLAAGHARLWPWTLVPACALTGAPFVASLASPDVWAGVLLLSWLVLHAHGRALAPPARAFVALCIVFAVASHASHVALALALALGSASLALLRRRGLGPALWAGGAVAAGVAATVATGVIGFGEVSVAPKRYPITLARSVADGPGLWHLQEHCETYRYAVCEVFPEGPPTDVGDFLWNEGGLRERASPEQMDRVRAEEAVIVARAAREYPFAQARQLAANSWRQFWMTGIGASPGGLTVGTDAPGRVGPRGDRWEAVPALLAPVHAAAFWASLGAAALVFIGPARRSPAAPLMLLALLGLAANAVVCGALSVPASRYQARVAWVLPIAAWVWGMPALRARGPDLTALARRIAGRAPRREGA